MVIVIVQVFPFTVVQHLLVVVAGYQFYSISFYCQWGSFTGGGFSAEYQVQVTVFLL